METLQKLLLLKPVRIVCWLNDEEAIVIIRWVDREREEGREETHDSNVCSSHVLHVRDGLRLHACSIMSPLRQTNGPLSLSCGCNILEKRPAPTARARGPEPVSSLSIPHASSKGRMDLI